MVSALRQTFEHARRHWLTLAFLLGFIVDNLTLNRVDQLFDNALLLIYILLAMLGMSLLYAAIAGRLSEQIERHVRRYAPLLIQYAFGGLLSGMLIFYGRSGTIADSWPFYFIILAVIYGNETINDRVERLIFNFTIFFVGVFSYCVLIIPVVTGKMGPWIFLGSGILSIIIMYWFFLLLRLIIPNFLTLQKRKLVFAIGCTFAALNFLYFANVIPPIPLSLKDVGIFHGVIRFDTGEYRLTYEKPPWWNILRTSDSEFHFVEGDNIYCFARVFAPTRLATDIYHSWEYFDEDTGDWVEHGRYSYAIEGGRGDGFRGYTLIKNVEPGRWRCTVETERGQVIGRKNFSIVEGARGELVTRTE